MNIQKNNKGITIIELIVIVTVLAILGTVVFFAIRWYFKDARDMVRVSDINSIKKAMNLYVTKTWKYPEPTNPVDITYSWSTIWTQWTFWKDTLTNVWVLNKKPTDPYTEDEYTYSVSSNRGEYELAGIVEWWISMDIFPSAYAEWVHWDAYAYVTWDYNWLISRVNLWGIDYILATPSIVSNDLSKTDYVDLINNKSLVYNNNLNLPESYKWWTYDLNGWFDFNPKQIVVFTWSLSDLKDWSNQIILLDNLKKAYGWTIVQKNSYEVAKIATSNIDLASPSNIVKALACNIVNFKLKYFVECNWLDFITFYIINVLKIDITNLPWDKINTVFQDDAWDFWFGTNWGIWHYDWTNWIVYDKSNSSLVNDNVTSIAEDNLWNYWFWTVNWISKFDGVDNWVTYNQDVLVSTHVQYIYTSGDGTIWIWTNGWVTTYNDEVWNDYTSKVEWLSHNNITAIFEDSNSNIWFWTNSKWVDKYTVVWEESTITNYNPSNTSNWLPNHIITYIFEDSLNNMWFWTQGGLWKTSSDYSSWDSYTNSSTFWGLSSDKITYIYEDLSTTIWFWTDAWVVKYDWVNWTTYNTWNWLSWDYVHSIYSDTESNILVLTEWWVNTIDSEGNIIE